MNEILKAANKLQSIASLLEQADRTDTGYGAMVVSLSDRTAKEFIQELNEAAGLLARAGENGGKS